MTHIERHGTSSRLADGGKDASPGRWLAVFARSCVALLAFVYLALWAFNGFQGVGLDWPGTIALSLGTILAAGLGVGLMALIFYSDRSERDRGIGGFGRRD
jgi:hypothetical protein